LNYKLLFLGEAKLDLIDAFIWYETQRDGLGFDFELCVEAGLNFISKSPLAVQTRYDDVRVCFIERFPYGIYYLVEDNTIKVFGVIHTGKNPENWSERLIKK
jgi:hypothetical protein